MDERCVQRPAIHPDIILWNTVYMTRVVRHLRDDRGDDIPTEWLPHLAPLGWQHINLTGN